MNEGYCRNCRNRESRPYYYKDYCPTIDEYVGEDDDTYSMCCDCFEEDC